MFNSSRYLIHNITANKYVKVSTLAKMMNVTPLELYAWMANIIKPYDTQILKLQLIDSIIYKLISAKIDRIDLLINSKFFDGKSMVDLFHDDEYESIDYSILIDGYINMKKDYEDSKLPHSTNKPNDDWKSYMSLCGGGELSEFAQQFILTQKPMDADMIKILDEASYDLYERSDKDDGQ